MATLTFLEPSGSNLRSAILSTSGRKKLTPTSNNAPWIYCNYPERIGDGNKSWGTACIRRWPAAAGAVLNGSGAAAAAAS